MPTITLANGKKRRVRPNSAYSGAVHAALLYRGLTWGDALDDYDEYLWAGGEDGWTELRRRRDARAASKKIVDDNVNRDEEIEMTLIEEEDEFGGNTLVEGEEDGCVRMLEKKNDSVAGLAVPLYDSDSDYDGESPEDGLDGEEGEVKKALTWKDMSWKSFSARTERRHSRVMLPGLAVVMVMRMMSGRTKRMRWMRWTRT